MQNLGNVYIWGSPFVMSRTDVQNGVKIIFNKFRSFQEKRYENFKKSWSGLSYGQAGMLTNYFFATISPSGKELTY